jgi:predicted DNA-binding transcriptional regulator AlpA
MEEEVPSRFERLWSIDETARYLAMSTKTLYGWRCRKYGPPSYRLGNKIRYRPAEVRAWVDKQNAIAS